MLNEFGVVAHENNRALPPRQSIGDCLTARWIKVVGWFVKQQQVVPANHQHR